MNKNEALERLTALESEAAALRKIIEAPEPAPSLLTKPEPLSRQDYWCITDSTDICEAVFRVKDGAARHASHYVGGNIFTNEAVAKAYTEAIDTLLLLRHQPGTVAPVHDEAQCVIEPKVGATVPYVQEWNNLDTKVSRLSPCFGTHGQAQAAIDAIGADRIERMWKTLHHIKD